MSGDWDLSEVDVLARDLKAAAEKTGELSKMVVAKTGVDTVASAQDAAPVDTGNLKNSIGVDFDGDGLGFEAGPTASYGADVEYGTAPHVITPRTAKALYWPGAEHPVKRVQHPGTAPQPYMIPSFTRHAEKAGQAVEQIPGIALW